MFDTHDTLFDLDEELNSKFIATVMENTHNDVTMLFDKMHEYGADSLIDMGRAFFDWSKRKPSNKELMEAGCAVYAYGKVARIVSAIKSGVEVSGDSWVDLTGYSLLARYFSKEFASDKP